MAHSSSAAELPVRRLESVPRQVALTALVLIGIGAVALISAILVDTPRAWRAYTFNWLFWTSVAQGAFMLSVIVTIARGVWSRPLRRFATSFVAFLPVAWLLFLPILFVGQYLFPWHDIDLHGKEVWLNLPFLALRNLLLVTILFAVSLRYAYWALRPDLGQLRDSVSADRKGLYQRLTGNWLGHAEEVRRSTHKLARLGPVLALLYALTFSMLAWDYVMSRDYHWFSTLIGPYFFMGAILGGTAATALLTAIYRRTLGLEAYIPATTLHDIGKLTFGFCVFWAYMFWSQFIVIWYGQLPWEQSFVIQRFVQPFLPLSLTVLFFLFIIPFFGLLGVKPKKTPAILGTFTTVILTGLWLERYVITYPSNYVGTEQLPFGWIEVGMALPFAGLFLASLMFFPTRFPLFQLWIADHERELLDPSIEPIDAVVTTE